MEKTEDIKARNNAKFALIYCILIIYPIVPILLELATRVGSIVPFEKEFVSRLVFHIAVSTLTLSIIYKLEHKSPKEIVESLDFKKPTISETQQLTLWSIIALLLLVILIPVEIWVKAFLFNQKANFSINWNLLEVIVLPLFVGLNEEVLFRGYLLNRMGIVYNKWIALIISSILFGVIHIYAYYTDPLTIILAVIAGMILGFLYLKTNNIWCSIIVHALNNTLYCFLGLSFYF